MKTLPQSPGIYRLTTSNGLMYVGATGNLQRRRSNWRSIHKDDLDRFEVLEYCSTDELISKEIHWQEKLDVIGNDAYTNKGIGGGHPGRKISREESESRSTGNSGGNNPFFGKKHSVETRGRMSKIQKAIFEDNPERAREISKRLKGNTYWVGRKHSEDTKKKISAAKQGQGLGVPLSAEVKEKISKKARARAGWHGGMVTKHWAESRQVAAILGISARAAYNLGHQERLAILGGQE